jgi:hypothetical protein
LTPRCMSSSPSELLDVRRTVLPHLCDLLVRTDTHSQQSCHGRGGRRLRAAAAGRRVTSGGLGRRRPRRQRRRGLIRCWLCGLLWRAGLHPALERRAGLIGRGSNKDEDRQAQVKGGRAWSVSDAHSLGRQARTRLARLPVCIQELARRRILRDRPRRRCPLSERDPGKERLGRVSVKRG